MLPIPTKSTAKGKKKMLVDACNRTIHFGAAGMSDYTKHNDEQRRLRYYQRHYSTSKPNIKAIREKAKNRLKNCTASAKDASTYYLW